MKTKQTAKYAGILMGVAMLAGLTACGEDAKVIEGTGSSQVQTAAATETAGTSDEPVTEEMAGWVFQSGETAMTPDMDAAPVVELLGEPQSYFEAASCAFEGLDKIYTYPGFEMETYPQEEKDCIKSIILKDDTVSTPEGLSIGDSEEKVRETYGEPTEEGTGKLVYQKDQMKLVFVVSDGLVMSIEYDSMVME